MTTLDEHTPTQDLGRRREDAVIVVRGIGIALATSIATWVGVAASTYKVRHAIASALS